MITAAAESEATRVRRIELILRQVQSLPTLPAVVLRLLALTTASAQGDAKPVIELIRSDAALTAKLLALCRRADLGVRKEGITVDKAVVLLGFSAVRNAVLSLGVYDLFGGAGDSGHEAHGPAREPTSGRGGAEEAGPAGLDRKGLWRHSLAVAVIAEQIAAAHGGPADLNPGEAFVCGLLHDIGKLALDYVLPKSFARVVELTDLNQGDIAEFERRVIGIDHHTAGKRLAEQWQLPHQIQDCIWLHGSPYDMLPRLDHRRMIGLVSLADLIARLCHVGYSGNCGFRQESGALAGELGLDAAKVSTVAGSVFDEVERRCRELGVDAQPSRELLIQSIEQANAMLGRLNAVLERRTRAAARQAPILDAIAGFHGAAQPGRGVEDAMGAVVASATGVLGGGFYAMIYQRATGEPWLIAQFDQEGCELHSQIAEPPPHAPALVELDAREPGAMNLIGLLPWMADYVAAAPDLRTLRVLALGCGWGTAALLVHDRPALPPPRELRALTQAWGSAIAAAGQHDGARRVGEELAEANRALAQAQDRLLQSESMVRLGEMAAGAAHEMNNPLAVICGRAQLLVGALSAGSAEQVAAQTIADHAQRLSDLITSLRLFADPPKAQRRATEVTKLVEETIGRVRRTQGERRESGAIDVHCRDVGGALNIDPQLTAQALGELVVNALQAKPRTGVHVHVRRSGDHKRLVIEVTDDGAGMDRYVLDHALDPFFSAKPAGRQMGLGLARARQFAAAHGGGIELRSTPGQGTTAVLTLGIG